MAERRFRTHGQEAALAAIGAMLRSGVPHALLLVGPPGVGKTTLALDLAAALLCRADPEARPCGECRSCRAIAHGNHPDLHRLAPGGAGAVIPIGGRDERGVRDLVADLALMPVEGGARVAVIEAAHRMTEDAQTALLKTLEEPPAGAVLVLAADDEERLLPTIRSRSARLRLGPVSSREIEGILADRGLADAPTAGRVARLAAGRPGVAVAYAAAPDAGIARAEIGRGLLDLIGGSRTRRLAGIRDLATRAADLGKALEAGTRRADPANPSPRASTSRKGSAAAAATTAPLASSPAASGPAPAAHAEPDAVPTGKASRVPAAERRAAALALVAIWRDVLRDLAAVGLGEPSLVRDTDLLDELEAAAPRLRPPAVAAQLRRLDLAGERLEGNVSPELVLDVLALQHGRAG